MSKERKALWTLNVGNSYSEDICYLTYPLMKYHALKIGADFNVITERKFPKFPPQYEKLQIYELGRDYDFNLYVDGDALIHPNFFCVADHLRRDTVAHTGNDMAGNRWKYDQYFRRDGRHIGSCNWFTCAWSDCLDLWKPLDDLTMEEALENIFPTLHEMATHVWRCKNKKGAHEVVGSPDGEIKGKCTICGLPCEKFEKRAIRREDLLDDYTLSRNIAR